MAKTIQTRKVSDETIEYLNGLTPQELEDKYRNGDFLYFGGMAFMMVFYSARIVPGTEQSAEVTYWCEPFDLEINLDWIRRTVDVIQPLIDWEKNGF